MPKVFLLFCLFSFFISLGACQEDYFFFEGYQGRRTKIKSSCVAWTDNCFLYCRIPGEVECNYQKRLGTKCTSDTVQDPYCVDDQPDRLRRCGDTKNRKKQCGNTWVP